MSAIIIFAIIFLVNSKLNTGFQQLGINNQIINKSVNSTWDVYYSGLQNNINFIALGLIIGMIVLILITMFLTRLHPAFIILYIIFWIIGIIFSVYLSNAFQSMQNSALSEGFNAMPAALWMMNNLVTVIVVLGIIGGILLFVNINLAEY